MCLILKLLQLQPDKEIIVEFIKNEDYKYVRVLGEPSGLALCTHRLGQGCCSSHVVGAHSYLAWPGNQARTLGNGLPRPGVCYSAHVLGFSLPCMLSPVCATCWVHQHVGKHTACHKDLPAGSRGRHIPYALVGQALGVNQHVELLCNDNPSKSPGEVIVWGSGFSS